MISRIRGLARQVEHAHQAGRINGPSFPQSPFSVPATSHQPDSASVSAPTTGTDPTGSILSTASTGAGNLSALLGLGQSNTAGILSGKAGAMGHMIGAVEKGREGDTTGMGLKGLSALGSLAGMMAPRIGMAMQAPEHIRDIASGEPERVKSGAMGLVSLHPIGALTSWAAMHPKTQAAMEAQGPGFLEGTKTDGPFGSLTDVHDPFNPSF